MLKLGSVWIELWELSDFVVFLFTAAFICNFLCGLLFVFRHRLEQRLSMRQMDRLLKLLLAYILVFMPFITAIVLYKETYVSIDPYEGLNELGFDAMRSIKNWSISSITPYGNHWIFLLLLLVWLLGFLIRGLYEAVRNGIFMKRLRKSSDLCENSEVLKLKRELMEELGLKKQIPVWESSLVGSPFASGGIHPEIYFPQGGTEAEQVSFVLRHELLHCRSRDPLYRKALFWICSFYWFNPFLRRLAEYYVEINEMACDEMVLKDCTGKERLRYGELLAAMECRDTTPEYTVSLTGHTKSQLERRLENMMKKKTGAGKRTMVLLSLLLAAACPLTTMAASSGASELQDILADCLLEDHKEVMTYGNDLTEQTDTVDLDVFELEESEIQIQPRLATSIEKDLRGNQNTSLGNLTVSANDAVKVYVKGDPASAVFRIGYINSSGRRVYVDSSEGKIDHEFTISKAGTYEWFAENLSSSKIHISGNTIII